MATPTNTYTPVLNAFTATMVEKLARQLWSSKTWVNPLMMFKKGFIENANEIEEVYVSRLESVSQDLAGSTTLDRVLPDVKTQYHKQEYGNLYTTTVSDKQARRAFWSTNGVRRLADELLAQLSTGYQYDEYVAFKGAIETFGGNVPVGDYGTGGQIVSSAVVDEATAKELVKNIKKVVADMQFRSTKYATYESSAVESELVFVTTPAVLAEIDVELLASAFNMEKTEIPVRVIKVDGFTNANWQGIVMDSNGLQLYDTLYNMETQRNAQGMFTNYHLNVEKIISTSNLYNGAVFAPTFA